ncbi:NAD(P)-dependent oxidoreductase [Natrarchaeobius sp. A-rgal3]|uniref:NAD(P)-dependent oxidoreductase n=1 Tax=Natrarchaeobius versutus TaxID=1679078 RepID=UPI00350EF40E
MAKIGFIGLGVMGGAMARNLAGAGYDVTAYDLDDDAVSAVVDAGATGASTSEAAVAGAEVVFLSLPSPDVVTAVVDDIEDSLEAGAVLVDLTTSTPETTNEVADRLSNRDVDVLGAPVSGGASGAEAATLTIMAGGDRAVYDVCEELFEAIGTDVYYVGSQPGHGHAVKLLNNYLSFTALLASSEAVILGTAAGLDPEILVDVFSVSSGRNSATQDKIPNQVLTGEYDNGFKLSLMEKDMHLLSEFSDDQDVPLLIAETIETLITYTRLREGGDGDMTRTYDLLESLMRP